MLGRLLCLVGRHKWVCLCGKELCDQGIDTECRNCRTPSQVQLMPVESIRAKGQFKYHYCNGAMDRILARKRGKEIGK